MRRSLLFALFSFMLSLGVAHAQDAAPLVPYQKMVGETFIEEMDGQPVHIQVVYDGMADSNIISMYKMSKIDVKGNMFIVHHDPAGAPGTPTFAGGPVMPPFAIGVPKALADTLLAAKPGTVLDITGVASKTKFGMMGVTTKGLCVTASAVTVVPATPVVPAAP